MEKRFLLIFLVLMTCIGFSRLEAKKLRYGDYIYYKGKVEKHIPVGLGALYMQAGSIVSPNPKNRSKESTTKIWEELSGMFAVGGTVTEAKIRFASGWTFEGTLKYQIAPDGSDITYTLTDGQLTVVNGSGIVAVTNNNEKKDSVFTLNIEPEHPLTIVRIPHKEKSRVQVEEYTLTRPATSIYPDNYIAPLRISNIGNYQTCNALVKWKVSNIEETNLMGVNEQLTSMNLEPVSELWDVSFSLVKLILQNGNEITCEPSDLSDSLIWHIKTPRMDEFSYRVSPNKSVVVTEDGTVADAKIRFASGWTFEGSLKYKLTSDSNYVSYTLTDGELTVVNASDIIAATKNNHEKKTPVFSLNIEPEHPLTVVRIPHKGKSRVLVGEYTLTRPAASIFPDNHIAPLCISDVGNYQTCDALVKWKVGNIEETNLMGVNERLKSMGLDPVSEIWGVFFSLEKLMLQNGNEITCEPSDLSDSLIWHIKTPKGDTFSYQFSHVLKFQRKFNDGRVIYDSKKNYLVIEDVDKSKLEGLFKMQVGTLELSEKKQMKDYSVKDVYVNFMDADSLASLHIEPVEAKKYDASGKQIDEYNYGISLSMLKSRFEAIANAKEKGIPYVAEKVDVIGKWTWKDPYQLNKTYSRYILTLAPDGKAQLLHETDYYDWNCFNDSYSQYSYYVPHYKVLTGTYSLEGNRLEFTWNENKHIGWTTGNDKDEKTKRMGVFFNGETKKYIGYNIPRNKNNKENTESAIDWAYYYVENSVGNKLAESKDYYDSFISQMHSIRIVSASYEQLILDGAVSAWKRIDSENESNQALKKLRAEKGFLKMDDQGNKIDSFKQFYEDGVVEYTAPSTTIIKYNNGDKFVGKANFGDLYRTEGEIICRAILEIPSIRDYEIAYIDGTLTTARGETIKYTDYLTENQINGIANNLEVFAQKFQKSRKEEMAQLQKQCLATKAKLLQEGFPPAYVNSMFDQFYILQGTPRMLVDRAIQLGCHIERHEYAMEETSTGDTFYAIHITNYKNGNAAFDGFIKFDYWTNRVNYVGTSMY